MKKTTEMFREMLRNPGLIHAPIAYDPFTARIAEQAGFCCLDLGGYALGASMCVPEPLISLEELCIATRRITSAVNIPLMVDGGAGYGDATYVVRTVQELERAGAAAVHIEDQVYPKRIHYHKGIEHVIPADEMCEKIHYAAKARRDPDFVIAARTDAAITDGIEEAICRANMYADAGADMVMIFPGTLEDTRLAAKRIRAPLIYVNSEGNRLGRPVLSVQELESMGYKMVNDAISAISVAFTAVRDLFTQLRQTGSTRMDQAVYQPVRKQIEDLIGLEKYYEIEEHTVEKRG